MAQEHRFRSAMRGFQREDVIRYIEYLNNKHISQVNQLKSENQALKDELAALRGNSAAESEIAELREQVAQLQQQLAQADAAPAENLAEAELEAYRRAERAERAAKERSAQIFRQTAGALSEATALVDDAADQFCATADGISAQIAILQKAVQDSKQALQDAAAAMYAIRPEED